MKWQYVFNTNLLTVGISISQVIEIVKMTGYIFFTFNGIIYYLENDDAIATNITTDELF